MRSSIIHINQGTKNYPPSYKHITHTSGTKSGRLHMFEFQRTTIINRKETERKIFTHTHTHTNTSLANTSRGTVVNFKTFKI